MGCDSDCGHRTVSAVIWSDISTAQLGTVDPRCRVLANSSIVVSGIESGIGGEGREEAIEVGVVGAVGSKSGVV